MVYGPPVADPFCDSPQEGVDRRAPFEGDYPCPKDKFHLKTVWPTTPRSATLEKARQQAASKKGQGIDEKTAAGKSIQAGQSTRHNHPHTSEETTPALADSGSSSPSSLNARGRVRVPGPDAAGGPPTTSSRIETLPEEIKLRPARSTRNQSRPSSASRNSRPTTHISAGEHGPPGRVARHMPRPRSRPLKEGSSRVTRRMIEARAMLAPENLQGQVNDPPDPAPGEEKRNPSASSDEASGRTSTTRRNRTKPRATPRRNREEFGERTATLKRRLEECRPRSHRAARERVRRRSG